MVRDTNRYIAGTIYTTISIRVLLI